MSYDCKDDLMFIAYMCSTCGEVYRFPARCHRRTCPTCNLERSNKLKFKYRHVDEYIENPFFVTFTLKNTESAKDGVNRIRKAFKELCKLPFYRHMFAGGVYAIECGIGRDGKFNVHIHACIDSCVDLQRCGFYNRYDTKNCRLAQDWLSCTGDSFIIKWERARYPKHAISYCLKYSTKNVEYGDKENEVMEALYKSRLISMFGVCYRMNVTKPNPFVCESCGDEGSLEYLCSGCYSALINVTLDNFDMNGYSPPLKVERPVYVPPESGGKYKRRNNLNV